VGRVIDNVYVIETGPIWLDDVACRGNERDIFKCPHRPWGSHNCGHRDDVSISCYDISTTTAPITTTPRPGTTTPETLTTTRKPGTTSETMTTERTTARTTTVASDSSGNLPRQIRINDCKHYKVGLV